MKKAMDTNMIEEVASRFKTLSDPSRLQIVQILMDQPQNVTEIVRQMECSQPNVSKHLQILYQSGLVGKVKEGNQIIYEIIDPYVHKLCDVMCKAISRDKN